MKKLTAWILVVILLISVTACSQTKQENGNNSGATEKAELPHSDYVLSDDVKEGSVIDGVMTDITGQDPILRHTNASWLDTCVLYEVNIRQFTEEGTFAAFEGHLDRLKEMGINTLWLMPIHPISKTERKGTLGSYYAVSDYLDVNPEFGTKEEFRHLVDKAHDMGFKVMLDWVANHTGWDNAWIKEHEDWYVRDKNGEIRSPYDWTDTAQLNYDNFEMRAEMIRCMQYWVEEMSVDGFRCDHAMGVPAPFWNAAVYKLKSINSEIVMLAEASANNNLTTYAFDCCYNDNFYGQAMMVRGGMGVESLQNAMTLAPTYSEGSYPMNYLDNHDKNSYEGSIVGRFPTDYPTMLTISFLAPGVPLIYTSNEEGYDHQIEFFEKDTVKWDDDPKYAGLIKKLAELKTGNGALATTNTGITFAQPDNPNVTAFTRTDGKDTVIFIAGLYNEEIKNAGVKMDFDDAVCVLHFDGTTLDTEEKEMSARDFERRDYQPYEYFVLVTK